MWGVPATLYFWNREPHRKTSSKWHIVNEASLEQRPVTIKSMDKSKTYMVWFGTLNCGNQEYDWLREPSDWEKKRGITEPIDERRMLVLKDTLKISQANICAYCKKAAMKKIQLENVEI